MSSLRFMGKEAGQTGLWCDTHCRLSDINAIPSTQLVGYDFTRPSLVRLNKIGTGHCRFQLNMNQPPVCEASQDQPHTTSPASVRYTTPMCELDRAFIIGTYDNHH